MKKSLKWLTLILALILLPSVALAASPWTEKTTCQEKAAAKFAFGMKNVLFGWYGLIKPAPCPFSKDADNEKYCPVRGLMTAIGQTAGGALHVATFLLPIDIPLPGNGTQLLK